MEKKRERFVDEKQMVFTATLSTLLKIIKQINTEIEILVKYIEELKLKYTEQLTFIENLTKFIEILLELKKLMNFIEYHAILSDKGEADQNKEFIEECNEEKNKNILDRKVMKVCIPATSLAAQIFLKLFIQFMELFEQFKLRYKKKYMANLIANMARLETGKLVLISAIDADEREIFFLPYTHPKWKIMKPYFIVDNFCHKKYEESFDNFSHSITVGTGIIAKGYKANRHRFINFLGVLFQGAKSTFDKKKSAKEGEIFMEQPDKDAALKIWNIQEDPLLKLFVSDKLSSIKVNKVILIPKLLEPLTSEVLRESNNGILNHRLKTGIENTKYMVNKRLHKYDSDKYTQVRILCRHKLPIRLKTGKLKKGEAGCEGWDGVIIHLHGGGFISASSKTHQNYTRKWANMLNWPIFSIDYGLAPDNPFPQGLDDIWNAYYWVIVYSFQYLRINPQRIIIVGDSAGANLGLGLTLRAIQTGFRVPDGLILAYPPVNLCLNSFTPALLFSLDDPCLRYTYLSLCLQSYIPPTEDPKENPYISPLFMRKQDLLQFPKIRIFVGGRDPLRDESYRFLYRFAEQKKDIFLKEYKVFPHGFWSLSGLGLKGCDTALREAVEIMTQFMTSPALLEGNLGPALAYKEEEKEDIGTKINTCSSVSTEASDLLLDITSTTHNNI